MASNTFRSDPRRAAELACILTQYAASVGATVKPHLLADTVAAMQKAARAAKRWAEIDCSYPTTDKQQRLAESRERRETARLNGMLAAIVEHGTHGATAPNFPHVELGGDPRGPCARLHIPGQRGDGWGEGFAIY